MLLVSLGAWFYYSQTRHDKPNNNIRNNKKMRKLVPFWVSPTGPAKITIIPRDIANNRYDPQMVVPIVDMHMPYLQTKAEKVRTGYDLSVSSEARSVRSDNLATSLEEGSSMYSFPSELTDEYQCVRVSHIALRDNMSNNSSVRSVSTSSHSSSDTSSHSSIHSVSTCSADSDSD